MSEVFKLVYVCTALHSVCELCFPSVDGARPGPLCGASRQSLCRAAEVAKLAQRAVRLVEVVFSPMAEATLNIREILTFRRSPGAL